MEWWKPTLGVIAGLFGANALHTAVTKTAGQKIQVGDIAQVPIANLNPTAGAFFDKDNAALNAMKGVGGGLTVPVRVMEIGPVTMTAGGGFKDLRGTVLGQQVINVEFNAFNVRSVTRNGVPVTDGPHRLF